MAGHVAAAQGGPLASAAAIGHPDWSLQLAVQSLVEGQTLLQAAVSELIRSDASRGLDRDQPAGQVDAGLNYQDVWPDVEVTVAVNELSRYDVAELSFDADFFVFLDWLDPQLRRGVHYNYNADMGAFELSASVRKCTDDSKAFNPSVCIENCRDSREDVLRFADTVPAIFDEVQQGADGGDVPWLTKKFHFQGTFSCRDIDARHFPFDVSRIQIRIASQEMDGCTQGGKSRRARLVEPTLRPQQRSRRARDFAREWGLCIAENGEGMSHVWRVEQDGCVQGVGEMALLAAGGVATAQHHGYVFYMVLRRVWFPRYFVSFMIMCLQVIALTSSLWVPFSNSMLADRTNITIFVLLTLVACTNVRPAVVDSAPYPTIFDNYCQSTLFFAAGFGISNLFVFTSCWGMYRGVGPDDDRHPENYDFIGVEGLVVGRLYDRWWCKEGPLSTSCVDFITLMLTGAFLLCINLVVCWIGQVHRIRALLHAKHLVDSPDASSRRYSRLVLCPRGRFEFVGRHDFVTFAQHAAVLPQAALFWRAWCLLHWLRCFWLERLGRPRRDGFHPADSERLLTEATEKHNAVRRSAPHISTMRLRLTPCDTFRVIDVGSGEMGFYSYWMDQATRAICVSGIKEDKLKYRKGLTFADHFIADPDGTATLHKEVVKRFGLDLPRDSLRRSGCLRATATVFGMMAARCDSPSSGNRPSAALMSSTVGAVRSANLPGLVQEEDGLDQPPSPLRSRSERAPEASPKSEPSDGAMPAKRTTSRANTAEAVEKVPLLICFTGANRQLFGYDVEGRAQLDAFLREANLLLAKQGVECIAYSPTDADEAMYELWATEWVVQHGDLDVSGCRLDQAYKTLGQGQADAQTTLKEVLTAFSDLRSDVQLTAAYRRAGLMDQPGVGTALSGESGSPVASGMIRNDFWRQATQISLASAADVQEDASQGRSSPASWQLPPSVSCASFYRAFDLSAPLLRALLRSRLFSGTLSAGSGSSQVTLRRSDSLEGSQVHSVPLGNRTPLVSMKLTSSHEETLFSRTMPRTRLKARELLCGAGPVKETRPAWQEDGPADAKRLQLWRELVEACAEERGLPVDQRGLFVGISAVYYAAQEARCDGRILERDDFLHCLERRRAEIFAEGSGDSGSSGRVLANLTLVIALVGHVLHRNGMIVCKRKWRTGEDERVPQDLLATWTLGLFLKHSGVMGSSAPRV